ncbi:fasciclin domain-containing protein [Muricauda sp. 2012CJ35-5]|uniref:Fasciclin domain-containing protein n=1 Tax=Flagellimonas spongiicola TaxID=2942208 RepID=A0ABT0PVC3_9FLAO|nr:fasciclin domain-containing protein [Allomuricauda spongiicola]MCL6275319.1 fasciclin domain-containing protein [Allomuricauda spongiicola]
MRTLFTPRNLFLWLTLALFTIVACEVEDDQSFAEGIINTSTIVETAQATDALSSLVAALSKADESEGTDLIGTLSGTGPFTVFAPTNEAFTALLNSLDGFNSLDDFDTDEKRAILTTILQYHVVAGVAATSDTLSDGQAITTVQGEDVTIVLNEDVFIDDATEINAQVSLPDVSASNGVVHVINKVLLPQAIIDALNADEEEEGMDETLVDIVVATDPLSLLEAAVIKAELVDTLNSEGPFTVFAPTNDAFEALLMVLGDDYLSLDDFDTPEEIELLKSILLYHVIPAKVLEADLAAGDVPTALADNSLSIINNDGTFVIDDASETNANITGTDIMASNGVAHTIDKVLLPQAALEFVASLQLKTIVELAIETDDLSILVDALIKANAGLVETLSGDGPFTVFAPTNEAFVALLDLLGDDYNSLEDFDTQEEIDLLIDILTYHVVAGTAAFSTDLIDGQMIPTVSEDEVTIKLNDGMVYIKDASDDKAKVVIPNVEASNGVVHVINKVLLPQAAIDFVTAMQLKSIVEIAVETDDLSLLVDALVQANAGLVETLSGDGPFTVFAPTNAAFEDLFDALGFHGIGDFDTEDEIAILVKVLTYHVVAGTAAFSVDLSDGQHIATFQGENVGINIKNNTVHIEDATDSNATVVLPDVAASNGVVHVINKVLLPQAVLDLLNPPTPNIVELAQSVDDLSLLVDALVQADAGLVGVLSGDGPFTVFAPTNEAFAELLDALGDDYNSLEDFDEDEEKELLAKILTYHVVAGAAVESSDLYNHQRLHTVQGESLFAIINHGVFIRDKTHVDAEVIGADNVASNGIVHVIDKVLLPREVLDALH